MRPFTKILCAVVISCIVGTTIGVCVVEFIKDRNTVKETKHNYNNTVKTEEGEVFGAANTHYNNIIEYKEDGTVIIKNR